MRDLKLVFATAALVILAAVSGPTFGQSPAPAQPQAPAPSATPPSAAVTPTPAPPALTASDLQGLDVFGSEGQQLGKVAKVNSAPDGKVKDVEVQSGGFLGFFKTTYVLPVEKLAKKAGRIELSMTSGDAKQFTR
jgi:sporulation protein YlmC with PRC-barrel domain